MISQTNICRKIFCLPYILVMDRVFKILLWGFGSITISFHKYPLLSCSHIFSIFNDFSNWSMPEILEKSLNIPKNMAKRWTRMLYLTTQKYDFRYPIPHYSISHETFLVCKNLELTKAQQQSHTFTRKISLGPYF